MISTLSNFLPRSGFCLLLFLFVQFCLLPANQVHGQNLGQDFSPKTQSDIVFLLKVWLEQRGRLYSARSMKGATTGTDIFRRYTVQEAKGTKFLTLRMETYTESVSTRQPKKAPSFMEYPELDWANVKNTTIRPTRALGLFNEGQWDDSEVIVEFKTPHSVKVVSGTNAKTDTSPFIALAFTTLADAQYAEKIIEALSGAKEIDLCPTQKPLVPKAGVDHRKLRLLYVVALGIVKNLKERRDSFLETQAPEKVFPAFYYYVTVEGIKEINKGSMERPDIALEEIIKFYDAYEFNRLSPEGHWKPYYDAANDIQDGIGTFSSTKLLNRSIDAHIDTDLPRALISVFKDHPELTVDDLESIKKDFFALDDIFESATNQAFIDLSFAITLANPDDKGNNAIDFSPSLRNWWARREAKRKRKSAWELSRTGKVPLELGPQPTSDYDALAQAGIAMCP